jgi:uncharacterized protein with GYD domain
MGLAFPSFRGPKRGQAGRAVRANERENPACIFERRPARRATTDGGGDMKHMIVNTHNAESCAFRSEEDGTAVAGGLDAFGKVAAELGMTIDHFWMSRAAHTFFIVVDAPTAHAIDEAVLRSGLMGRTRTEILPIHTMEQVRETVERRSSM